MLVAMKVEISCEMVIRLNPKWLNNGCLAGTRLKESDLQRSFSCREVEPEVIAGRTIPDLGLFQD